MKKYMLSAAALACYALMVSTVHAEIDINNDSRTGLAEAVQSLQAVADKRSHAPTDFDGNGVTELKEAVHAVKNVCDICNFLSDHEMSVEMNSRADVVVFPQAPEDKWVTDPDHGQAEVFCVGNEITYVRYTPDQDYSGSDSFVYSVNGCMASVSVTVKGPSTVMPFADSAHGLEP